MMTRHMLYMLMFAGVIATPVFGQFDSGSDGALNPNPAGGWVEIGLSLAATATWGTPTILAAAT